MLWFDVRNGIIVKQIDGRYEENVLLFWGIVLIEHANGFV